MEGKRAFPHLARIGRMVPSSFDSFFDSNSTILHQQESHLGFPRAIGKILRRLAFAIFGCPAALFAQSPTPIDPPQLVFPSGVATSRDAEVSAGIETLRVDQREALFQALAAEASVLERLEGSVQKVARVLRPSVVHIEASKKQTRAGHAETFDEAGSGVIVEASGGLWVLTNRHVIRGAKPEEISLRLSDGREIVPLSVLADEGTDVAILRLGSKQFLPARVGDSREVEIGDFVIAVGSPFGLSHSVTFGIISAMGRRDLTLGSDRIDLQDFFQTDAAINPGNSGGPLVNLRGEVIGLNTAIASSSGGSEGIGFAIPIQMVQQVVDQLIRYGEVRRGYLGVSLDPAFNPGKAERLGLPVLNGALVKTVRNGSPAMSAGIHVGDVITEFDGVAIENDDHLVTRVGLTAIGREIGVILYRNGRPYQTYVTITAIPEN